MALIEIDGLPINSMGGSSMAMLVITRWYHLSTAAGVLRLGASVGPFCATHLRMINAE